MRWWMRLIRRERLERELDTELRHHVEEETRRLESSGVSHEEAHRRALATFGGLEPMREQARDARGTRWLEDFVRDVRYAGRLMRRSPIFTLAAVCSLAVGIGANTAIFSVIDALLLRPLPIARPGELSFINRAGLDEPNRRFSHPRLREFERAAREARFAGVSSLARMQVARDQGADLVLGQLVSASFFDVAAIVPQAGTFLVRADDEGGGHPVVVLSDRYWSRRFARDPTAIGRSLLVNGQALTIVGIAPEGFDGLTVGERADLWAPTALQPRLRFAGNASNDGGDTRKPWNDQHEIQWLTIAVRIPRDASAPVVTQKIEHIFHRALEEQVAGLSAQARQYRLREHLELLPGGRGLSPLRESFSTALGILMSTVALVLLVACANLANLLLARNAARSREITVRLAIGARRGRLMRQLLTESLVIAVMGGAAGLAIARWGGQFLLQLASGGPAAIPLSLPIDARLFAFSAAVSVLTGVLFGLAPALRWSRADLQHALRGSGRVIAASQRFGKGLVIVQVALALVLLIGAALFVQTFRNYLSIDPGFDREHVVSARFDARLAGITEDQLPALNDRLLASIRQMPGVRAATLAVVGPATGAARISSVSAQGHTPETGREEQIYEDAVGPSYFETVAMPLLKGRDFTERDDARAPLVAIINEAMARHYFPGQDPIGKRFGYSEDSLKFEVVGVVADARVNGLRQPAPALAYHPLKQHPEEYVRNAYVRSMGPVESVSGALRAAITTAEPNLAVREIATLAELSERSIARERLVSSLVGVFSVMAVAVACLGLYGTVSYSVARRTNEIGVRLAMGATPGRVRWLVLRESAMLVAIGCGVGLAAIWPGLKYVGTLLYGLSPHDPTSLIGATAALLIVGLVAALVPAWRASRVDPLTALRTD
jgi:predicted permease